MLKGAQQTVYSSPRMRAEFGLGRKPTVQSAFGCYLINSYLRNEYVRKRTKNYRKQPAAL